LHEHTPPDTHIRHPARQRALLRGGAHHGALRVRRDGCPVQVPDARRGDRMNGLPDLPAWAAIAVAICVLIGSGFTLIGAIGLLRLETLYQRVHAPTIGSSFGVAFISAATIICVSALRSTLALAAVFVFLTLTMPAGLILLARAALFRDRAEGRIDVPPMRVAESDEA